MYDESRRPRMLRRTGLIGWAWAGFALVGIAASGVFADCHIVQIQATGAISTIDNATSVVWVTDGGAVVVTTHVPNPFELTLSIGASGSAEITGVIPAETMVDSGLSFSSADRFLWCIGSPQYCTPPFEGNAYLGFRYGAADGVHYGWVGVYCQNLGFGRVDLRYSGAAYQTCAGHAIPAGAVELQIPVCDSVDFDCDGDTGTDADIEAFFRCLAGDCPAAPCTNDADFDNDGEAGTDADIAWFFSVLGGGPCGLY
jgi:hypothetical protein